MQKSSEKSLRTRPARTSTDLDCSKMIAKRKPKHHALGVDSAEGVCVGVGLHTRISLMPLTSEPTTSVVRN
jgi:hypothetical protein